MRLSYLRIPLILFVTIPAITFAIKSDCDGSINFPCTVSDTTPTSKPINHWRTMQMIAKQYSGDIRGLANLRISGSASFNASDFDLIKNKVRAITLNHNTPIINLDLREESHGFLNDQPITLMTHYNWINLGKNHDESLKSESTWIDTLKRQLWIHNVLTTVQFKDQQFDQGNHIVIANLTNEKTATESAGFKYQRLTVSDHRGPRDEEVDRFIKILKHTDNQTWLHLHCRGGEGRTTTFLAMYDMLKNADRVSFDEIINRQAAVAPYYHLSKFQHKNPDLIRYYEIRLAFLKEFYQFAIAFKHHRVTSWSQWKANNQVKKPTNS